MEDVVITFTPGLSELGEKLVEKKKERDSKREEKSVWEQARVLKRPL